MKFLNLGSGLHCLQGVKVNTATLAWIFALHDRFRVVNRTTNEGSCDSVPVNE